MIITWYTVCYFLPDILGGERDSKCTMRTAFANGMFAWVLAGSVAVIHLCFILGYACKSTSDSS